MMLGLSDTGLGV